MNDTIGAHDGEATAIVSASDTPMTMPGGQRTERRAQPAQHHRREDDADPGVDLRRREREGQGEAHAGDAGERGADPGEQQREPAPVDAEGRGDRAVLGDRAHRRPRSV